MPMAVRMKGRGPRALGAARAMIAAFRARRNRRQTRSRVRDGLDDDLTVLPAVLDVARRRVRQASDRAVGASWDVGDGTEEPGRVDPPADGTSSPFPGARPTDRGGDGDMGDRRGQQASGPRASASRRSVPGERGWRAEGTTADWHGKRLPGAANLPASPTDTRAAQTHVRARARVLGHPALLTPDGAPVGSLRDAALEVLVFLAVHRDGSSLEAIKESVYGDATRVRAAERLSTGVANLRNRIRHALAVGREVNPVVNVGGRYRLDPRVVEVDWWDAEDALARSRRTDQDPDREQVLRGAAGAFHGVLADGVDYEWAAAHRERTRRAGIAIHTRLAGLIARTNPQEAARLLTAACDLDPYDEDLACHTMRAQARVGDHEAVRARMRCLRAALAELDESPDSATETLVNQLTARRRLSVGPRAW